MATKLNGQDCRNRDKMRTFLRQLLTNTCSFKAQQQTCTSSNHSNRIADYRIKIIRPSQPRLSWKSQCDSLYNKACQQLGIVRRNGHIVTDPKCRRALYLSLVRSQFENCSIVWRPTSSSLTKKLESLQKRAIKWILSEEGHSYSPELYVQKCKFLDILPLSAKFDLNDLLFFHKVVNDLVPISLPSYLSFYQGGSRLRSCHLDKLSIVSSLIPISSQFSDRSNNPFSKSFFYRTHLLWNNLSLELREILCPSLFKLEISKHLWNTLLTTNSPNFDDDFG